MAETPEIEYRCLWEQRYVLVGWIPCSGPVGDFSSADWDQEQLRKDSSRRNVSIEARVKSNAAWPRPWECGATLKEG